MFKDESLGKIKIKDGWFEVVGSQEKNEKNKVTYVM